MNKTDENGNQSSSSCCTRLTDFIIGKFEAAFFSLGQTIGKWPLATILISLLVAGLCGIGMINFTQENRGEKLWNPQDSIALANKAVVDKRYPVASRINVMLFESSNVLTSKVIKAIMQADKNVKKIYNGTNKEWDKICYRQGIHCMTSGLLEIWGFNETLINTVSDTEIIEAINKKPLISPITKRPISLDRLLGSFTRNSTNHIVNARAALSNYFIKYQYVFNKKTGQNEDKEGQLWETEFGKVAKATNAANPSINLVFYTRTSFRAASSGSISSDLSLLSSGYILIIAYLAFMLGKFTRLKHKIWLAVLGVLCVGLSILVSFGLSSAFGLFYGPVHSILPFLILGIGVDDVFVIIQSLDNITKKLPEDSTVAQIIGATMKHAGVAISVTSMTDVIAFLVGATTILPALRSFCIYAGLGILAVFFFSCTLFTAFLAYDLKRQQKFKDACCCCVSLPENYQPFTCAKTDHLQKFFTNVIAKYLMKLPVKIAVLVAAAGIFAAGCYGSVMLEQNFDFNSFLPPDADATKYNLQRSKYFPNEGVQFSIYIDDIDYFKEQSNLHQAYLKTFQNQYVVKSSVSSWYEKFNEWIGTNYQNSSYIDKNNRSNNETYFYNWLRQFLQSRSGASFQGDVTLSNSTGVWKILYSRMHATHIKMANSPAEVKAMDSIRDDISKVSFSKKAFVYSRFYVGWETNKIISVELFRNLGLAAACVFLVTLFLIANLWTSLMVFTCVFLTLADVGGMMHFWGLTIDTVTSVMMILAIGLCVDYAAHIGHSFMTAKLPTRNARAAHALGEIGPAVLNGGFSTFLAFVCLSASSSYVFKTFFKVFFLVVVFGLFHGLLYLPSLLSLIGPRPYSTAQIDEMRPVKSPTSVAAEISMKEDTKNGSLEMQNEGFKSSSTEIEKT